MNRFILISIGAALGANARYLVDLWAAGRFGASFPYGTFLVNATGSLLLGFMVASAVGWLDISPEVRLLVGVGFLGSYTTFSSLSVESIAMWQEGNFWHGVANVVGTNVIGLLGALLGIYIGRVLG